MSGRTKGAEQRAAIEAEAARRYFEARDRDRPEEWAAAYEWVALDPAHGVAFARAEAGWELSARLREAPPPLGPEEIAGPAGRFEALFSRRAIAATVAVALIGTAATVGVQMHMAVDRYRTAVGEERAVTLADGSLVHLNTDSAVEVAYRADRRFIRLLRGEARFDVAHQPTRPFIVAANDATLRALGTAFNVRLRLELTELTVIDGRVTVRDGPAAAARTVDAGTGAAIRKGAVAVTSLGAAQISQRIAWQDGILRFDGQTLGQAVEEFNRYRAAPLVIGDPALVALPVSGTFRADRADHFVAALAARFAVRVVGTSDASLILLPAADPRVPDGGSTPSAR